MTQDIANKEKQFERNIIDIPAREKQIRDTENERRKEMERNAANSQNINYIKTQMDERNRLKREWQEKDAYETRNLTEKAIQEYDEKEKMKRDYTNKLKGENLTALQRQIDDRRIRMADEDKLNSNEANLNNYIGVISA